MSGVLRLSNNVTGRSTIIASASNDQTYVLPALGGTLVTGGASSEIIFPPGTEALPGLHVQGDIDTGLYAPAANTLAISTAGSERLRVDSSGRLLVGTSSSASINCYIQIVGNPANDAGAELYLGRREPATTPITADQSLGAIRFGDNAGGGFANIAAVADATSGTDDYPGRLTFSTTADGASSPTERMRIDSSGKVGIGASVLASSSRLTLFEDTGNAQTLEIIAARAGGVGSQPGIKFTNNTGGNLGGIYGEVSSATVNLQTGGTVRMQINSSGTIVLPDGSPGIQFGSVSGSVTSTTLDDYEEGTWSPATTNFTYIIDASECRYTKIGRMVYLTGQISRSQTTTPAVATVTITGLPFNQSSVTRSIQGSYWVDNQTTATDYMGGFAYANTPAQIIFAQASTPTHTASSRYIQGDDFDNNRGALFSLVYITD